MLQVSILRLFHQILSDGKFRKQPKSSEVVRLAADIVRHIFARLMPACSEPAVADRGQSSLQFCILRLRRFCKPSHTHVYPRQRLVTPSTQLPPPLWQPAQATSWGLPVLL